MRKPDACRCNDACKSCGQWHCSQCGDWRCRPRAAVIPLHTTTPARARGAATMVACASKRYGHPDADAQSYADQAAEMVRRGHSAARAVACMKRRAMSEAPPPSAA